MYPLLLNSPAKSEVWGGNKIGALLKGEEYENASEAWLCSASEDGESVIKNGDLKGETLGQVFEKFGKKMGGSKYEHSLPFPFLIKIIDAKDSLPLGVSTKERLIYISEAENDAKIIFGFVRDTSDFEMRQRISSNTCFSVLNLASVKKGDIINIPAGTIHAIGKGILCYEILYGDEEFYPVSDYGRTDSLGKSLPLKPEAALKIMNYKKAPQFAARIEDTFLYPFGTVSEFPANEGLSVSLIRLGGSVGISENDSFVSVVTVSGSAAMSYPSGTVNLSAGDSIIIPAGIKTKFTGYADIICTHL